MLAALGGCDPQIKGHVAANLRVGNDRKRLIDVATQLLPFIGYPRTLNALRAIDEIVRHEEPTSHGAHSGRHRKHRASFRPVRRRHSDQRDRVS
jgi:hypothetical protein